VGVLSRGSKIPWNGGPGCGLRRRGAAGEMNMIEAELV
jgi:hypothetical protein